MSDGNIDMYDSSWKFFSVDIQLDGVKQFSLAVRARGSGSAIAIIDGRLADSNYSIIDNSVKVVSEKEYLEIIGKAGTSPE